MALLLPRDHRARPTLERRGVRCVAPEDSAGQGLPVTRVGVINLMPKAEDYEQLLLGVLGADGAGAAALVEPVWIRLHSHHYSSSDQEYIGRAYRPFERALDTHLHGLILTGAPVEELAFGEVRYWEELREALVEARRSVPSTLGLCWGAMAMGKLLGVEKRTFAKKLFGLYELDPLRRDCPLLGSMSFACPQSRHSGTIDEELERAAQDGMITLLARSDSCGYSIFESTDRRFLMHQGHPEYRIERLLYEYRRDCLLARRGVEAPVGIDVTLAHQPPMAHGAHFVGRWLAELRTARERW
jgi:homoserine O-succinyltransferase